MSRLVMSITSINRRALLQTGAAGAGALVFGGAAREAAAAPATGSASSRSVLAWVVLRPEQEAEIRIARKDSRNRVVDAADPVIVPLAALCPGAERVSAWTQMRAACARAQALAVEAAAREWAVAPESCAVLPGRIVHAPSGRSVAFGVWADMA